MPPQRIEPFLTPRRVATTPIAAAAPAAATASQFPITGIAVSLLLMLLLAVGIDQLLSPGHFIIKSLELHTPGPHVTRAQLNTALQTAARGNYFSVDLEAVRKAAEALSLVQSAHVKRQWPDTLSVRVQEHPLLARWGRDHILTAGGTLVPTPADATSVRLLPLIEGPAAMAAAVAGRYHQWQQLLLNHGLQALSLNITPRRSWEMVVRQHGANGAAAQSTVRLLLGNSALPERMQRFLAGYKAHLHNIFGKVRQVDLRYPNGFSVRWVGDSAAFACADYSSCIQ